MRKGNCCVGDSDTGADTCLDDGLSCRTKQGHFRIYSLGSEDCVSYKYV